MASTALTGKVAVIGGLGVLRERCGKLVQPPSDTPRGIACE